jgi:reactive chlorine resistance protein C
MKGTQAAGQLGQDLPLGPHTDQQRIDKTTTQSGASSALADKGVAIAVLGSRVLRYGLVLVVGWIGLMKFTGYEANGIQPLVAHSPLMGWMYHFLSVRQFSDGLGVVEVAIALLIALRPWSPKASAVGSALAMVMFLTTLSFLFSTPGWEPSLGGFPALSASPGQFLLKDLVLLGAAIWSLGESLTSVSMRAAE